MRLAIDVAQYESTDLAIATAIVQENKGSLGDYRLPAASITRGREDCNTSTAIARNPQDLIELTVDSQVLQLGDVRHLRSNHYTTRPPHPGSAISMISDLLMPLLVSYPQQ